MIRLLIAPAGAGKTHWLTAQHADVYVDCTTPSHRQVLVLIASAIATHPDSRTSIADIVQSITTAPHRTIALDNIDRAAPKLQYSILSIAARHDVVATATDPHRVTIITDRAAAELVDLPKPDLREVVLTAAPNLSPDQIRQALAHANTPAQATHAARAIRDGKTPPTPRTVNLMPLIVLALIYALYLLRYEHLTPAITALAAVTLFLARRLFRLS